ncbi:MAG: uroporphyrinogen-III synthase, partial [Desulfatiglandales bacterium]
RIIPGISSAMAVPAYAGIPLTHRDYASSVAFVTGHEREEKTESTIRWEHLGKGVDTLVFLMGMGNAGLISQRLMENGRSPETPVAVIQNGTTPSQRTLLTQLSKLEGEIRERGFKPPGIIVVGEVARLSERLNWFEGLPLFSRKIVITRPKEQGEEMAEILRRAGADVIQFPTIEIAPPDSSEGLDMAIGAIETFDLVIFTSANGVRGFFQRLFQKGLDSRSLKGIRIVCIGPKTSSELFKYGIMADLIPGEFRAEGIVEALSRYEIEGKRILIPRAQEAREVLAEALKDMGGEIYEEPAYKTTIPQGINLNSTKAIFSKPPDLITFTSSSTVRNLIEILKTARIDLNPITEKSIAACIGPITSQTASKAGFKHIIQAERYTAESLLKKIFDHFEGYLPQSKRR